MIKFDFSLSKEYFRAIHHHSVRYWVGKAISAAYIAFVVYYLYALWFFGALGRIAHEIRFYFVLFCAFIIVRSMILSIPSVRAWRAKRKKIRISFMISNEEIKINAFDGKVDTSHIYPFSGIKKVEEKNKYFTISYVSSRQKQYLLKSDITEGSVEELRQLLTDNLGDKFKSAF